MNNLPDHIREDSTYSDLYTFINMWGEHFDVIRSYIDNFNLFSSRKYSQLKSVPGELLPILAKSFGWDVINPFSSSLDDWFVYSDGGSTRKLLAENTWRKILNNLIYIYKSKGTENSIRGLLNSYGYPADFLPIKSYGGNYDSDDSSLVLLMGSNTNNINYDAEPVGVSNVVGNQRFHQRKNNY